MAYVGYGGNTPFTLGIMVAMVPLLEKGVSLCLLLLLSQR